jgi:hypothetical protein
LSYAVWVLPLMLVLFVAAGMRSAKAAHAARTLEHRSSLPRYGGSPARAWRKATRFARPAFRPSRTITVDTAAGFSRAWRQLRPRDEIVVNGVTFRGEVALIHKHLSDWAEVHFAKGTKFVGVSDAENEPSVWLNDDSHIRFYRGDVSDSASGGMAGTGIIVDGSSYVSWWGVKVHDVGGAGLFLTGIKKASDHLDFKGDVYDWGHNLKWDPHKVKGTGLQGINIADSHYGVNESRLAFHVHDSRAGSGLQMGGAVPTDGARGNKIYLWCQNLMVVAPNAQGGSCAQVWGENVISNTFKYIRAQHLSGSPYYAGGMYANQSLATNMVVYGRASLTNLNPAYGQIRWDSRSGTVFKDVASR